MECKYSDDFFENANIDELKMLDGENITIEQTELLDENENIVSCQNNGGSGDTDFHKNKTWLTYTLIDGTEIDVYC